MQCNRSRALTKSLKKIGQRGKAREAKQAGEAEESEKLGGAGEAEGQRDRGGSDSVDCGKSKNPATISISFSILVSESS